MKFETISFTYIDAETTFITLPIIDLFLDAGKGSFKIMMSVQPVVECSVGNNLNLTPQNTLQMFTGNYREIRL